MSLYIKPHPLFSSESERSVDFTKAHLALERRILEICETDQKLRDQILANLISDLNCAVESILIGHFSNKIGREEARNDFLDLNGLDDGDIYRLIVYGTDLDFFPIHESVQSVTTPFETNSLTTEITKKVLTTALEILYGYGLDEDETLVDNYLAIAEGLASFGVLAT